jgi:hypothetical protein
MQTLRSPGWLVDFIVGSLLWSIAIVLAASLPSHWSGSSLWQIFYN